MPTPIDTAALASLESAIKRDLAILDYPRRDWVRTRNDIAGQPVYDVVIIGGGQSGLAVAFSLMRERAGRILVIDENPQGFAGPWKTFARMITLRTPKYLTGPDLGIPNLSFQAWYEAQYGVSAYESLKLIPKESWADYLIWYQRLLEIPVRSNVKAGSIEWLHDQAVFKIPLSSNGKAAGYLYARKTVLATGIDGSGRWDIPALVQDNLPKRYYAHTREDIDFAALRGKKIGILGAGASAFDNASVALEQGAAEVHLFFRRPKLVDINPYRWAEFAGFLKHESDLPDADRWRFMWQILHMGQLPPHDTFQRATSLPAFHLHADSVWEKVQEKAGGVELTTNHQRFALDHLIIGTGFVTDLSLRPELANLWPQIALWQDHYHPPVELANADLGRHPYLGRGFEFQEKPGVNAPWLRSLFNYTFGGLPSHGFGGASISGMKFSLPKIVGEITRQLFVEDAQEHFLTLQNYADKEF